MMAERKYRQVHDQYLIEWLGINFPPGSWRTNVPLGDQLIAPTIPLTELERKYITKPLTANADAVIITENKVIIVEAMVRHEPGAGEDLLKYKYLFPYTTEFARYKNWPIELVILTPLELGWYEKFYQMLGIKVVNYSPAWIWEYLYTYPRRMRRGQLSSLKSPEEGE
jgi:hypothetical protein